jgi:hypothetical protein
MPDSMTSSIALHDRRSTEPTQRRNFRKSQSRRKPGATTIAPGIRANLPEWRVLAHALRVSNDQSPPSEDTTMSHAITAISRPSLALLSSEPWRAAMEFISLKLRRTKPIAAGDGHPVIIFPGLATDANAVAPLLRHCKALGYAAMGWGRGFNRGPQGEVDIWTRELADEIAGMISPFRRKATLIGWSLGGIYAREVAKLIAPRVRQVITIGTPFNATADHTNVGWILRLLNRNGPAFDQALSRRLREAPSVPTTSIFSRLDGIVAWQTCLHAVQSSTIQDIEVDGSHIGMGWNPEVLTIVGDRLAQPIHRKWQRYESGRSEPACEQSFALGIRRALQ